MLMLRIELRNLRIELSFHLEVFASLLLVDIVELRGLWMDDSKHLAFHL